MDWHKIIHDYSQNPGFVSYYDRDKSLLIENDGAESH